MGMIMAIVMITAIAMTTAAITNTAMMTTPNIPPYDYLTDPGSIYAQSFKTVQSELDLASLPDDIRPIAIRVAHACGMTDIAADLNWHGTPAAAACAALQAGGTVLTDVAMVAAGVIRSLLPEGAKVETFIGASETAALAKEQAITRSMAGVDLWPDADFSGAVVLIGNAPTALFRLLERIHKTKTYPAAIFAFPVGFVGAIESKQALAAFQNPPPFVTLHGRRGGSAMASAALNGALSGMPG
jgi:precorrin-8X/cobalt-precorrin-8 methylmutase